MGLQEQPGVRQRRAEDGVDTVSGAEMVESVLPNPGLHLLFPSFVLYSISHDFFHLREDLGSSNRLGDSLNFC